MFGSLKKSLKDSIRKITKKAEEPGEKKEEKKEEKVKVEEKPTEKPIEVPKKEKPKIEEPKPEKKEIPPVEEPEPEVIEEPEVIKEEPAEEAKEEPREEKRRFFGLGKKITTRTLSEKDIDSLFDEIGPDLLKSNVAFEVVEFLKIRIKEYLTDKQFKRGEVDKQIKDTFKRILLEILDQSEINIEKIIKDSKSDNRPTVFIFLGFNGGGKTSSIAKITYLLKQKGYKAILAAADTFRAAAQEQLEIHGERLGTRVIKHKYGSDPAAVVYDAIEHAKAKGYDLVLADTAGRSHVDKNLMAELKKIIRVNKPDLKILVLDSLAGNDICEQTRLFDEAVGVDALILTKLDCNEKGGAILSARYTLKKPILFLGTGQDYKDLEKFEPKKFVKDLLSYSP